jgi:hypothetical protein
MRCWLAFFGGGAFAAMLEVHCDVISLARWCVAQMGLGASFVDRDMATTGCEVVGEEWSQRV